MKINQKVVSVITLLLAAAAMLAACGQKVRPEIQPQKVEAFKEAEPSKAPEKVKIRVTSFATGEDPFTAPWQEVLKKFMEQNGNVEIIDESTSTTNDALRTKVKTDFASGNEPDVSWFFMGADAKPLVESGRLFEFDGELAKDTAWSSNIAPAAIESGKYNGRVYAIPVVGFYEGLFCNKDLFDENGVKIPVKYDELLAAVDTFNSKGIIPFAASIDESYYLLEHFILSAGGTAGHNSEFKTSYDLSWVAGINAIKDMYQRGAFPGDALTISDEAARNLFYDKKAAMMINGSWCAGQVKDTENTVITYFPVIKDGKAGPRDIIGGYGSGFYLSRACNDSKGGIPLKLVKFLSSPEMVKVLTEKAGIPGVKTDTSAASPTAKSGLEMFAGASTVSFPLGDSMDKEAFTYLRKNLAYVVEGKKTADELLAEALKLVKQ